MYQAGHRNPLLEPFLDQDGEDRSSDGDREDTSSDVSIIEETRPYFDRYGNAITFEQAFDLVDNHQREENQRKKFYKLIGCVAVLGIVGDNVYNLVEQAQAQEPPKERYINVYNLVESSEPLDSEAQAQEAPKEQLKLFDKGSSPDELNNELSYVELLPTEDSEDFLF